MEHNPAEVNEAHRPLMAELLILLYHDGGAIMGFIMVIWQSIIELPSIMCLIGVFLLVFSGHWFPWHIIPGATDDEGLLKSTLRYTYGCGCIFAGPLLFSSLKPEASAATMVTVFALSNVMGGLGAVVPRLVRMVAEGQRLRAENAKWRDMSGG